jgi:hypothetical protein
MVSETFCKLEENLIPGQAKIQRYGNKKHGIEMLNWSTFRLEKKKKNYE